ncbi:MAG: TonB-dependent receptor [Pseudomonadota bacterium]
MISGSMIAATLLAATQAAQARLPDANTLETSTDSRPIVRLVQSSPLLSVEIPAGSLNNALVQLGKETGLRITFNADLVAGLTTPGVSGRMTRNEALKKLLADTELRVSPIADAGVVIVPPPLQTAQVTELQGIVVVDAVLEGTLTDSYAAPDSFSATRTDTDNIKTPQSSQSITRKALEDADARTVSDSYEYLAGVVRNNNTGGLFGDSYIVRGFFGDNILINGNRTGSPTNLDTANVERVELLRGPTATLFGRADPGGLVNIITKQPLATAHYHASVTGGAGFFEDGDRAREFRGTIDVGGPIGAQDNVRYRLNMAADFRRTFRQDINDRVFMVAPVVEIRLTDRTTANIELSYQHKEFAFDRGVTFVNNALPLARDFSVGSGQTPTIEGDYLTNTIRVDHRFGESLKGRLGIYFSKNAVEGEGIQFGQVAGTTATAQRRFVDADDQFITVQPELVAKFAMGATKHTVLMGLDASWQKNDVFLPFAREGAGFNIFNPMFPVNSPAIGGFGTLQFDRKLKSRAIGAYVQDQIDVTEQLSLVAGIRFDKVWLDEDFQFGVEGFSAFDAKRVNELDDSAWLPRFGFVYRPIPEVGIYASYSKSYRPPTAGGLTDASGNTVDAETGTNYEVGAKLSAYDGKLSGTISAFRADKENVLEPDTNDLLSVQQVNLGKVRSQGFEFDLSGEVTRNVSVGVSYAYTHVFINSDENANLPRGTRLRNVPWQTASLQLAYKFDEGPLSGLRLFGGVVYESEKLTNTSATIKTELPSYVRFDVGASYKFEDNWEAQVLIKNVGDEVYYTSAAGQNNVAVGEPFRATFGLKARF